MALLPRIDEKLKRYFLADIISHFGSGMSFIGLNWFLLMKTGMNEKVGVLMTTGILSGLIVLPITGPIADRFNRKAVLINSNFVRAFFILLTAVLLWTQPFHSSYVYFLAVVNGIGWNVYMTASKAFIQEISTEGDLLKSNAVVEISLQVGLFSAAAAAGFMYGLFGIELILLIDAATFIVSNILLARIKCDSAVKSADAAGESFARKFIKGYQYLLSNPSYFIFGLVLFLPFVATMTLNVVLPGYVSRHLGAGSITFGMMDMAYGIGACLSGFVVISLSKKLSHKAMLPLFFAISTASLVSMLFSSYIPFALLATLFFGLPNSAIRVVLNSIAMKIIDKQYMGRVMAIWSFVSTLLQLFSVSFVGVQMDRSGPLFGYLYLSAIMCVAFACYLWFSRIMHGEGADEAAAAGPAEAASPQGEM